MQTLKNNATSFGEALFEKAEKYFNTRRYGKYASFFSLIKGLFFVIIYITAFYFFIFGNNNFSEVLWLAVLLGLCHVLIPVNISHDAIHQSLSKSKWINQLGLYGMEITGANSYMYSKKHLEAHFNKENGSLVNNITLQGLLLQKKEKKSTVNLPYIFYLFYSQYMIFVRDFFLFNEPAEKIPVIEIAKLWLSKILYATAFLVLPFVLIPLLWWQILLSILLMYFIITVLLVVILLMPTEKMETNKMTGSQNNDQWLIEIMAHNVDFSPKSRLLNYIVGGANLNVVHYLFPTANHIHYNTLAVLIEEAANEFGVLYRKQEVKDVLGIHFNYLKNIQHTNTEVPADVK